MNILSTEKLADIIKHSRELLNYSQEDLSKRTGINRITIGRIEKNNFIPSISQLQQLSKVLNFEINTLFIEEKKQNSFIALRSEALTAYEKAGVEKLFKMMLTLKQQIQLRTSFENEKN